MKTIKSILFGICFLNIFLTATAAKLPPVSSGVNINPPLVTPFNVIDPNYSQYFGTWYNQFNNISIKNRIVFKIDRDANRHYNSSGDITINFTVNYDTYTPGMSGITPLVQSHTVVLHYDTGYFGKEKDEVTVVIDNAVNSTVIINSISYPIGIPYPAPLGHPRINFENILDIERVTKLNYGSSPGPISLTGVMPNTVGRDQFIRISWATPVIGAEGYELEYLFVNYVNVSGLGYSPVHGIYQSQINPTSFAYSFRNNATRVLLEGTMTSYDIPNLFPDGYIVARVRAVGKDITDTDLWLQGIWTMPDEGTLNLPVEMVALRAYNTTSPARSINPPYESMNSITLFEFSEKGNLGSTIDYYDGTLRSRQNISHARSNGMYSVNQVIFDYLGRESVTVLPSVAMDNMGYAYRARYNKSDQSGLGYNYKDFDLNKSGSDEIHVNAMMNDSGTSAYYSPTSASWVNSLTSLSPTEKHMHGFVPDAQGYPFSQIEFKMDPTNNTSRIGNIGKTLQLKSFDHNNNPIGGHESFTWDGTPFQAELDVLFGNEIGYFQRYKKIMTKDANGQLSVLYIDPFGKTVATALAGMPTDAESLDALPSSAHSLSYAFVLPNTEEDIAKGKKSIKHHFLVTSKDTWEFSYQYELPKFNIPCDTSLCFTCGYTLTISLKDMLGNEIFPSGIPQGQFVGNPIPSSGQCNSKQTFTISPNPIKIVLDPGEYVLTKILEIDKDMRDSFRKKWLDSISCGKTFEDFLEEEKENMDLNCDLDCESCRTEQLKLIHTIDSLREYCDLNSIDTNEFDPLWATKEEYSQIKEICDNICMDKTPCDLLYDAMVLDLTPGGQYASYAVSGWDGNDSLVVPSLTETSIFQNSPTWWCNSSGSSEPIWKRPYNPGKPLILQNVYLNDKGEEAYIEVLNGIPAASVYIIIDGKTYARPHQLNNYSDFIKFFEQGWVNSLLYYHPEYCYYRKCRAINGSYIYDNLLLKTYSAGEAIEKGFFNPLNITYNSTDTIIVGGVPRTINYSSYEGSVIRDPILGYTFLNTNDLKTKLRTIPLNCNTSTTKSFWQLYERERAGYGLNELDTCVDNLFWPLLRAHYLQQKREWLNIYYNDSCPSGGDCAFKTGGIKTKNFIITSSSDLAWDKVDDDKYVDKSDWQTENGCNPTTVQSKIDAQVSSYCDEKCANNVEMWLLKLANCSLISSLSSTALDALKLDLKKLCVSGCDLENPYGSITRSPSANTTTYPHANLNDVFEYHLGTSWFTAGVCDELLIDFPGEYGHDYLSTDDPEADTCACSNTKEVPQNSRCPENGVDSLAIEDCACDKTPALKQVVLGTLDEIDDDKKCKRCISCEDLENPVREFLELYNPSEESDSALYKKLLTTWLNRRFKFNLLYEEYRSYAEQCIDTLPVSSWVDIWKEIGIERLIADRIDFDELIDDYNTDFNEGRYKVLHLKKKTSTLAYETWDNSVTPTIVKPNRNNGYEWLTASNDENSYFFIDPNTDAQMSSPSADIIACRCEKILTVHKLLVIPYTTLQAQALYLQLFLEPLPSCSPYTFDDMKNMCSKMWNMEPATPGPSDPSGFVEGDKFNMPQKDHIDMQIIPIPTGVLACLIDGTCDNLLEEDTEKDFIDTCGCNMLKLLHNQWLSSGGGLTYKQYIYQQKGVNPDDPEMLLQECDKWIKSDFEKDQDEVTPSWTLGSNFWSNVSKENLKKNARNYDLKVPKSFNCTPTDDPDDPIYTDTCFNIRNCVDMAVLIKKYLREHPLPDGLDGLGQHVSQCAWDDDTLQDAWTLLGNAMTYSSPYHLGNSGFTPTQKSELTDWINDFTDWFIDENYDCEPIPPHIDMYDLSIFYSLCQKRCPGVPYKPITPKCADCYELDTSWVRSFVRYYNKVITGNPSKQRVVESKWKLYNDGLTTPRLALRVPQFYNSVLYESRLHKDQLKYNIVSFKYPYIRIQIPDQNGYILDYSLEYLENSEYINFGEIVEFKNPRGSRQQGCTPLQYFYVDVVQKIPPKYWSIDGCPSEFDMLGNPTGCKKTFTLLVRVNTKNVLKKTRCLGCAKLCNKPFIRPNIQLPDDCAEDELHTATQNAMHRYTEYLLKQAHDFDSIYTANCFAAKDTFRLKFNNRQYHYTLFYYDRAGNLIKTVSPEGIDVDNNTLSGVNRQLLADDRILKASKHRNDNTQPKAITYHSLITNYRYNSLNLLIWQQSPDAGISKLWYDNLGRIIASQNSKQELINKYSYSTYDNLGRLIQTGEIEPLGTAPPMSTEVAASPYNLGLFLDVGTSYSLKTNVRQTYYNDPVNPSRIGSIFGSFGQQNLINRVSSTTVEAVFDNDDLTYDQGTYFSYDFHGHIRKYVQDIAGLDHFNYNLFLFEYDYDVLSGNVNSVTFQRDKPDQLIHNYEYDEENVLTEVRTSRDGYNWETDAKYFYYLHGALGRQEYGSLQVQGVDYAYTIQGWLKSVNSGTLNPDDDMGRDGSLAPYPGSIPNPNKYVARDAIGYYLGYYQGDYQPIGSYAAEPNVIPGSFGTVFKNLYNGGIAHSGITLPSAGLYRSGIYTNKTQGNIYNYDQLSRLKRHYVFDHLNQVTNNWPSAPSSGTDKYYETFNYDANSNISEVTRNGFKTVPNLGMDDMNYSYETELKSIVVGTTTINWTSLVSNRLYHVNDAIGNLVYDDDIDDQGTFNTSSITTLNNYVYDEIGNLVKNVQEEIDEIKYNIYGKITHVTRVSGSLKPDLEYGYSASGQRLYKTVIPKDILGQRKQELDWRTTWYVNDPIGNLIATYVKSMSATGVPDNYEEKLACTEMYIYGRERLAVIRETNLISMRPFTQFGTTLNGKWNDRIYTAPANLYNAFAGPIYTLIRGNKLYEIGNYLGNVLVTVQDRKKSIDNNGDLLTDYYVAYLGSVMDYYAYGSTMGERSMDLYGEYRFGYNGKEVDNEFILDAYDFGARIYDSRLGRWFNVDNKSYLIPSYSPYVNSFANPINLVDKDGNYTKPSEALSSLGINAPPMLAGLMDGFIAGIGIIEAFEFGWSLSTDANFRSQMLETFKIIASDPIGFAKSIAMSYGEKFKEIANNTEKGQYYLGEIVGNLVGATITGAAAIKLIKFAKVFRQSKMCKIKKDVDPPDPPKSKLTKDDIFTDNIATRRKAEDYATDTKYKGWENVNEKNPNNPSFDLQDSKGNVVDITTNTTLGTGDIYKKIKNLSIAKGIKGSRTIQIYLPDGKFTADQIAAFKAKIDRYISMNKSDFGNVKVVVDVIK